MLTYTKNNKIALSLTLINNDGTPEENATVSYEIYNDTNTLELSGGVAYNEILCSYIEVINPQSDWINQEEGGYFVKWSISNTIEDYPSISVEELNIESYNEKLDRLLGLLHENIFIDNAVYDKWDNLKSARVRIYSDSVSVGTNNNTIGTYEITADTIKAGKFTTWKQVKI